MSWSTVTKQSMIAIHSVLAGHFVFAQHFVVANIRGRAVFVARKCLVIAKVFRGCEMFRRRENG